MSFHLLNERIVRHVSLRQAHLMVLLVAVGCSEGGGPTAPPGAAPERASLVVVSNPAGVVGGLAGRKRDASLAQGTIYVSLPIGSAPGGVSAQVRNTRTGNGTTAVIADGGFTPVRLEAEVGDTVRVEVQREGSDPVRYGVVVPAKAPPVIVRTSPPKDKRDLPLNTLVVLTFSEPIDERSLPSTVTLLKGGVVVEGTVTLVPDGGGFTVAFTPAQPLEPSSDYVLQVLPFVLDRDGDRLATGTAIRFSTGASSANSLPIPIAAAGNPTGFPLPARLAALDLQLGEVAYPITLGARVLGYPGGEGGERISVGPNNPSITYMLPNLPVGAHQVRFWVRDAAGRYGETPVIDVQIVTPTPSERLTVVDFHLAELEHPEPHRGWYEYAPQLEVFDPAGGVELIGFELVDLPGIGPPPGPNVAHSARWIGTAPRQLFTAMYGFWDLTFSGHNYERAATAEVEARIVFRTAVGEVLMQTVRGPMRPAAWPAYSGGCGKWMSPSVSIRGCGG